MCNILQWPGAATSQAVGTRGYCTPHISTTGCPSLMVQPHTAQQPPGLLPLHPQDRPPHPSACPQAGGGTTDCRSILRTIWFPCKLKCPIKCVKAGFCSALRTGSRGTRPREVTALHNSEVVKQLTQIAILALLLLTLILPLKPILLSGASQEKHPKL